MYHVLPWQSEKKQKKKNKNVSTFCIDKRFHLTHFPILPNYRSACRPEIYISIIIFQYLIQIILIDMLTVFDDFRSKLIHLSNFHKRRETERERENKECSVFQTKSNKMQMSAQSRKMIDTMSVILHIF